MKELLIPILMLSSLSANALTMDRELHEEIQKYKIAQKKEEKKKGKNSAFDLKKYIVQTNDKELISEVKMDQFIGLLEKLDENKLVNRQILLERNERLGVLNGLIIPTLTEMDYMLGKGDIEGSAILNQALGLLNPQMANGLGQRFGLQNLRGTLNGDLGQGEIQLNSRTSLFNFNRSFGSEITNFGNDQDFGGLGEGRFGEFGDRGGFNPGGDVTNPGRGDDFGGSLGSFGGRGGFGNRGGLGGRGGFNPGGDVTNPGRGGEFGGHAGGPSRGGFLGGGNSSPIFGNPGLRDDVASMSRGGQCVAGCGAGAPLGGSIGTVIGGIVGGVTTGGPGVVPGANIGGLIGGVVGCAAGCITGPPKTGGNDPAPRTGGDDPGPQVGGGNDPAPKTGGNDPAPKTGGNDPAPKTGGNDPAPKTGGNDPAPKTGGTDPAPKTGGNDPAPKTGGNDPAPKPGKNDDDVRVANPEFTGGFIQNDTNDVFTGRRLGSPIIIDHSNSPNAPLINFVPNMN